MGGLQRRGGHHNPKLRNKYKGLGNKCKNYTEKQLLRNKYKEFKQLYTLRLIDAKYRLLIYYGIKESNALIKYFNRF